MNSTSDAFVAEMLAAAAQRPTVLSAWSSCFSPGDDPGRTLKVASARTSIPPPVPPQKTVDFANAPVDDADYTVTGKLGEGGMGVVFEARQNHLHRRVALKMIRPENAVDPMARNSFFHEAVVTAGMEHPGIIPILEFGRTRDGRDFYAMKKATGVPWSRVIREKTLEENLAILDRVADVAAYAHAQGVLHRDIKPANVLLGDFGEVWLADWGVAVAKNDSGDYRHALPGGTPRYMAPEMAQCDGTLLGPASDIYLLGAVLYEVLSGSPPHPGMVIPETLENAASNAVTEDADETPADNLMEVVRKAMSTHPGHRYRTVQDMQAAIRSAVREKDCRTILARAGRHLKQARRSGEYDMYRRAIAEFDSAIELSPESVVAEKRRAKAVLAYARQALENDELDLALSIAEPEVEAGGTAAEELVKEIEAEQAADVQFRRRRSIVNTLLGLLVVGLLCAGAYIARYRYDFAADILKFNGINLPPRVLSIQGSLFALRGYARAGRSNAGRDVELASLYADLETMLAECEETVKETPWETPSNLQRVHTLLREKTPKMEQIILKLRERVKAKYDAESSRSFQRFSSAFGSFTFSLETFMPWLDEQ